MRLKTYRAPALAEAMRQLRQDMGPDALILATRKLGEGVEVTACLEAPAPAVAAPPPPDPVRLRLLGWHGVPRELAELLAGGDLAAVLPFAPLPADRPLLLAGPPGAGKTLTVLRLAARMVLAGQAPLIAATDTRRAGASDQLSALAGLMGVRVLMADGPLALARALVRRPTGVPVLIDTAGADLFARADREELTLLAAAGTAAIAGVLPAGLDAYEAADLAAALRDLGAEALVATRLDTARRLGSLLTAARAGLALAEAGIGPGVADGLVPLTPEFLAERLGRNPSARERTA
jgi:flagellar biosynthesis protein FlhF